MQKHTKAYMKAYGYQEGDWIPCECCGAVCSDVHHVVERSQGGTDNAENLIGLCRNCHMRAHKIVRPYYTRLQLIKFKNDFAKRSRH